ncbi:hypothetical protein [Olleya sp. ITB9]|uniref:hypothetical protein n=1 Tax=Olleya sp. ITB9 TaxID=1715648 RepID=UPI000AA603F5|nr:hypothetical protein [Olleya sp. ITB9]
MKYKFSTKPFGWSGDFGVDYESLPDIEKKLSEIGSNHWTPKNIQEIIDESNKLEDEEDYTYQVEGSDFFIAVKKAEVLMWARGSETPDITWSFQKFISFMKEFKKFVELNS